MLTRAQIERNCDNVRDIGGLHSEAHELRVTDAALRFALEEVQATNRGVEAVRDAYYAQYMEATESEDCLRAELEGFRGIFCEHDALLPTLEDARKMWDALGVAGEQLRAEVARLKEEPNGHIWNELTVRRMQVYSLKQQLAASQARVKALEEELRDEYDRNREQASMIIDQNTLTAQLAAMEKERDEIIANERERCAQAVELQAGAVSGFEREELIRMACILRVGKHAVIALPDYKDLANWLQQQLAASQARCAELEEALKEYHAWMDDCLEWCLSYGEKGSCAFCDTDGGKHEPDCCGIEGKALLAKTQALTPTERQPKETI